MPIYDITVPIRSGMPVYEGDPGIEIKGWTALAKGDSANVSFRKGMGGHNVDVLRCP